MTRTTTTRWLLLAVLLLAAAAVRAGDVWISVNHSYALVGNTTTVQVTVNNPMALSSLDLTLEFTAATADFVPDSMVWGSRAQSTELADPEIVSGKRRLILGIGGLSGGVSVGNDVLVSFTVQGNALGSTPLTITSADAKDEALQGQNEIKTHGSITVSPPPTDPVFAPGTGLYGPAQSVSITADNASSGIYYTTDGTEPTTSKTLYAGAFQVNAAHGQSVTVRAKAYGANGSNSNITEAVYSFDKNEPTVTGVSTTAADGWYLAGAEIPLTVAFSRNVTLAGGNLLVNLNSGGGGAVIAPFADSATAACTYVVQSGDNSTTLSVQSLSLAPGAILTDAVGNPPPSLSIPAGQNLADQHQIGIDAAVPTTSVANVGGSYGPNRVLPGIAGTATDLPAGTAAVSAVDILVRRGASSYWDGADWANDTPQWLGTAYDGGTGAWSYGQDLWPEISAGQSGTEYTILARGTDNRGNVQTSYASASFVFDSTAPAVSIGAPSRSLAGQGVPVDFPVTITGAATMDVNPGNVTLLKTGAADGTVSVLDGATASPTIRVTPTGAGDGTLAVQVQAGVATDGALNTSPESNQSTAVTVENTPPVVAILAPAPGATVNGHAFVTFTSDEMRQPQVSVNGTDWTAAASEQTTLADIAEFANLGQAGFTLYLRDTDAAGNVGSASVALTKDTVPPAAPAASPGAGLYNSAQNVSLTPAGDAVSTWYTLGGGAPDNSGLLFSGGAIAIDAAHGQTVTLRAASYDAAGNLGAALEAAYVFDKQAPTLSEVSIGTDNPDDPAVAAPGDTVTLLFTASEPIVPPVVTLAGEAAELDNTVGNTWRATRIRGLEDDDAPVGFRIEFTDLAGNAGVPVEQTGDGSEVIFGAVLFLPVGRGWNLLGVPLETAATISDIFAVSSTGRPLKIGRTAVWDAETGEYTPMSDTALPEPGQGYWISSRLNGNTPMFSGMRGAGTVRLVRGWNIFSPANAQALPAEGGLSPLAWWWDAALQAYRSTPGPLLPGRAYWLLLDADELYLDL